MLPTLSSLYHYFTEGFSPDPSPKEQAICDVLNDAKQFQDKHDYVEAYNIYELLAKLDDSVLVNDKCRQYRAQAQYQCGKMLSEGFGGIKQNMVKAYQYLTCAASSGFSNDAEKELVTMREANPILRYLINARNNGRDHISIFLTPNTSIRTTGIFASKGFTRNTLISHDPGENQKLIDNGTLVSVPIDVQDITGEVGSYSLSKNGFEVRYLPEECIEMLPLLKLTDYRNRAETCLIGALNRYVTSLAFNLGYSEKVKVAAVDLRTRDTNKSKAAIRQINLFHTDFPPGKFDETHNTFSKYWKPIFDQNGIDSSEYEIVRMINIWIPLDEQVVADPLTLIDHNHVVESSMVQCTSSLGENDERFHSMLLKNTGKQNGIKYFSSIGLGQCYIFDSTTTPHSAVPIAGQPTSGRRSVELRFVITEPKPLK